jgi:hypothetical protein
LRDTQTDGDQHEGTLSPYSRGTVFSDRTTAGLTFVSDAPISDVTCGDTSYAVMNGYYRIYPSGWLYFRSGTRYRIENGIVRSIVDRNGNKTTFNGGSVTDANGRETAVSYTYSQGAIAGSVTYKGNGGQLRTVNVSRGPLSTALRGGSVKTFQQLFPLLPGAPAGEFNDNVVTSMTIPDGREYSFKYNE